MSEPDEITTPDQQYSTTFVYEQGRRVNGKVVTDGIYYARQQDATTAAQEIHGDCAIAGVPRKVLVIDGKSWVLAQSFPIKINTPQDRVCDYEPGTAEPCGTCPRVMSCLHQCGFLQESRNQSG